MPNAITYLTQDLPGIGGQIKAAPEDFNVEEIPLYTPSGEGEHTYFALRKRNLATMEAIRRVASALHVSPNTFGHAGLKDAKAVTTQMLSVQGVSPERLLALDLPNIEILWAKPHRNKLRVGHLRANRFQIVVRNVQPNALARAQEVLARLQQKGVPNRFGEQRFGIKGDSYQIGRAFVQQDWKAVLDVFLGQPGEMESEQLQAARCAYADNALERAYDLFPRSTHTNERNVLNALMQRPADLESACMAMPVNLRKFFLSAYQSYLFNRVMERRLSSLGTLFVGDLAMKHRNGACFHVENPNIEQPRADAFEISPTGPLFGYKMTAPHGEPGRIETEVLSEDGLVSTSFHVRSPVRVDGARRALRLPIEAASVEEVDVGLRLSFTLPPGGYATVVLDEVMKTGLPSGESGQV